MAVVMGSMTVGDGSRDGRVEEKSGSLLLLRRKMEIDGAKEWTVNGSSIAMMHFANFPVIVIVAGLLV